MSVVWEEAFIFFEGENLLQKTIVFPETQKGPGK